MSPLNTYTRILNTQLNSSLFKNCSRKAKRDAMNCDRKILDALALGGQTDRHGRGATLNAAE